MIAAQTKLAAYRSRHAIRTIQIADSILGQKVVCETDGIRVHPVRSRRASSRRWRHDQSEIKKLVQEALRS